MTAAERQVLEVLRPCGGWVAERWMRGRVVRGAEAALPALVGQGLVERDVISGEASVRLTSVGQTEAERLTSAPTIGL